MNETLNTNIWRNGHVFSLVVTECGQQREAVSYNFSMADNPKGRMIFSSDFQENQKDINLGNNLRVLPK